MLALVAPSTVAAHMSVDIIDTTFGVPLMAPFSFKIWELTPVLAIAMQSAAFAMTYAAPHLQRRYERRFGPTPVGVSEKETG